MSPRRAPTRRARGRRWPRRPAAAMARLADGAERLAQRAIAQLPQGRFEAVERLDDGAMLAVVIDVGDGAMRIDFTGSSGVHALNLNATEAIVRSVAMYVVRVLVGSCSQVDGPNGGLNEGLLRPVSLHIPFGILAPHFHDDPARSPAVGAGNTETSQRVVDLLIKALGVAAASQGTMNNLLFGSDGRGSNDASQAPRTVRGDATRADAGADSGTSPHAVPGRSSAAFGYYETIGGGAGAGPGFPGADAVHVHMTNTRITDAEILEHRYPVRLERFAVRRGSGGAGAQRGGAGVVREIRFLEPMSVSLVTQRRASAPFGGHGGAPGAPGINTLVRGSGEATSLGSSASIEVGRDDVLRIETPGGGGWGADQVGSATAAPTTSADAWRSPHRAASARR
ncbi:MAG: hydantoinase B/oxoprolinase family protein [Phycisphaerales bacterium]